METFTVERLPENMEIDGLKTQKELKWREKLLQVGVVFLVNKRKKWEEKEDGFERAIYDCVFC